jgi:DnaJ-class molecular chaperone
VRIPTLTGAVSMTIPPMTNSGRTFRLRGKGLPTKSGHGDLLVTAEIRLPEVVDEALMDYAQKSPPDASLGEECPGVSSPPAPRRLKKRSFRRIR